uniref:Trafficking protein particle complex subunit n=1 Tax=Blastobotrys adeninivorans TaxID=409370 RepID=A0A060SXU1_BLAAD
MTIYSIWIFDKHCDCIYSKRWHGAPAQHTLTHRSTASTGSELFVRPQAQTHGQRSQQDDAKLIFGIVFSLRNMVRKLTDEDAFTTYSTSQYKLHYYETPSNLRFCLLTDPKMDNLKVALQQIYVSLYTEYVVKNPLSPIEHPGGVGVDNELFVLGLDAFISSLPGFE